MIVILMGVALMVTTPYKRKKGVQATDMHHAGSTNHKWAANYCCLFHTILLFYVALTSNLTHYLNTKYIKLKTERSSDLDKYSDA